MQFDFSSLILGVAIGIVVNFFTALIGYIFAVKRDRRTEFNKAAYTFRTAISDAMSDVIQDPFPRCQAAAFAFREVLPVGEKKNFDRACEQYSDYKEYHPFMPTRLEWEEKHHIETLLTFAKFK
jgi:hypothetical protein